MGILSPWMLLGLLCIPAIIVLYLLRLKRQPMRIPSVLLWQQVIDDHQANAPFQKLRRNLLMLVQILIAAFLVTAAIRPYVLVPGVGGKTTVVVLDCTASMQATDVRPSRFEVARATVRKMIDRMGSGDRMALVASSHRARTACPLTNNKQSLRSALAGLRCDDTHGSLKDGAAVAGAIAGGQEAIALFVTDAASAEVEEVRLGKLEPALISIGERANNVGITALAARPSPDDQRDPILYCQLHNAGDEQRDATLEFYQGPRLIDAREVKIPAHESKPLIVTDLPVRTGLLRAHLLEDDDLAADNDAYVYLGSGQELEVLVVTEGNVFLEQAITVDPGVAASRVAPEDFDGALEFDVAVLDENAPANLPPDNYLFVGRPVGEQSPLKLGREVEEPVVATVLNDHPINQFVDWSRVHFAEARPGKLVPGATALVECREGVLVACRQQGNHRSLALAFELTATDFPVRPDFPIFVANALSWLTQGMQQAEDATRIVPTGTVVPVTDEVSAEYADGSKEKLSDATRRGVLCPTRLGRYTVSGEDGTLTLAANLLDRRETDIRPSKSLRFAHQEVKQRLTPAMAKNELTIWFALAALAFMVGEWWLYHRRP